MFNVVVSCAFFHVTEPVSAALSETAVSQCKLHPPVGLQGGADESVEVKLLHQLTVVHLPGPWQMMS